MTRLVLFTALVATSLPTSAHAFSSSSRFAAPVSGLETGAWGGGGGRWFTGSPGDGFTCAVCHGEREAPFEIAGIPDTWEPGSEHLIEITWPADDNGAVALEIVDADGRPVGTLAIEDDEPDARCPADAPATLAWPVGEREVVLTEACGARYQRVRWTAPSEGLEAFVYVAGVIGNRSGDPTGDATISERFATARVGAPTPEAASLGCAAGGDGAPPFVALLATLVVSLARRRRARARPTNRGPRRLVAPLTLLALRTLALPTLALPTLVHADDTVSASLFIRNDTDRTTVITPDVSASVRLGDRTTVRAGYTVDIWTSASIDVRTAATRAIREQRDELNAGLAHELDDVTLGADYRFSHEGDYVAHGGGLNLRYRFADGNATLGARLSAAQDVVSRSGDDDFERRLGTLGALVTFTQNIDPKTLVQLAYELTRRDGYQASPYRFVGIGGDGRCQDSPLCVPETHPGLRIRNALALRARRAFGERWSFGVDYRFYFDDWGLRGNTILGTLGIVPTERSLVSLRYRFHHQTAASFYAPFYLLDEDSVPRFVTRDRELSPLFTHRLQVGYEHGLDLSDAGPELRLTVAVGGSTFKYLDFVGLDRVWALDLTLAAVVVL
ncbi:MAG: DUF3570 domain-containing protein [Sandaracinus sp.]|nr:DUF3570 domain-containing protein [Sandaracinus sp.]